MWLVPRQDLSEDQAAAVALDISRHRVLHGGPGSGKTLVLAHRTKALIEERGIAADRIRLLVYTNVLNDYIRQGLADLELADVAMGFDAWCRSVLREHGRRVPRGERGVDHAGVRRAALEVLEGLDAPPLDALLVDEGQDLDEVGLAILARAARHVTVAMDSRQQLYETGVSADEMAEALGVRRRQPTLLTAYRCTPHIVTVAAAFLDDPGEQARFRASNLMPIGFREQPVLVTTASSDEELDRLADELQARAMQGMSSLVLLPNRRMVKQYADGLRARGMTVCTRRDLVFDGTTPIVLTYHSAKGLTSDGVFLPHLSARGFFGIEPEAVARMLFVGVTRATQWVWLGVTQVEPLGMLDRLAPLVATGDIARLAARPGRPAGGGDPPSRPTQPRGPDPDPFDDLANVLG